MPVAYKPARRTDFPDEGPIDIRNALELLTKSEFALWAALCAQPDCVDYKLKKYAKIIGLDLKRTKSLARALHDKGFIIIVRDGERKPLRAHVLRPILAAPQSAIETY